MHHDPAVRQGQHARQPLAPHRQELRREARLHPHLRKPEDRPRLRAHRPVRLLRREPALRRQQVRRLQRVPAPHRVRRVPQRPAPGRHPHPRRPQQPHRRHAPRPRVPAPALRQAHHRHAGRRQPLGRPTRHPGGEPGQPRARSDRHPGPQPPGHRRQPGQPRRIVPLRVQVHRYAVLRRDLQGRRHVPGRIGVQVRPATDRDRTPPHRVPQQRPPVRARRPGQQPGYGDGQQLAEAVQRTPGPEHLLQRPEALPVVDPHVRAQRGRAVPELEQRGLRGPAPHLLPVVRDAVRHGPGAGGAGGERRVGVRVGLGGRGQQQIPREVHPGARGHGPEAARRPDGLDPVARDPYVHGPPVGEPRAREQERGRAGAGRGPVLGRLGLLPVG